MAELSREPVISPEQSRQLDAILKNLGLTQEELFEEGGFLRDITAPTGPSGFTAPLSGLETQSLAGISNIISGGGPSVGGQDIVGAGNKALQDLLAGTPGGESLQDFIETNIVGPSLNLLNKDLLPGVNRRTAGNFFGSANLEAEARAREDIINAITRESSAVAFAERGRRGEEVLGALGQLSAPEQARGTAIQNLLSSLAAGGVERGVTQADLSTSLGIQEQRQRDVFNILNLLLGGATAPTFGIGRGGLEPAEEFQAIGAGTEAFGKGFEAFGSGGGVVGGQGGGSGAGGGGSSAGSSGGGGGGKAASAICWVAREVYGLYDPRWMLFRYWLFTKAPRNFLRLYMAYGRQLAVQIRSKPALKARIRNFMDSKIVEVEYAAD